MSVAPNFSVKASIETKSLAITYEHNALNQRVAKRINGQVVEKYLWANLTTLLATYDTNDNLKQRFEYADSRMPVAMIQNGQKYYLHYDQVGSLRAVSDSSHTIVKEIVYDTYGTILIDSNPSFTIPFGFAGGLYDADTKLTRFGYRDYDAPTGKWMAKDPIGFDGGDSNLYGYVWNDPVNWVDPQGLFVWVIPWAIVEAAGWAGLGAGVGWSLWDASNNNPTWNFPTTDTGGGEVCYAKDSKKSGKDRATDIPSWANGERPLDGENGNDFAERLLNKKYGPGNWKKGPKTEHNKLRKNGDRR